MADPGTPGLLNISGLLALAAAAGLVIAVPGEQVVMFCCCFKLGNMGFVGCYCHACAHAACLLEVWDFRMHEGAPGS